MMDYQFDLVGKIGSMALIRKEDKDIDYNIFSRLGAELKPGMIWVTSGATEIGRLDYLKRTGCELCGSDDEIKGGLCRAGAEHPDAELPAIHPSGIRRAAAAGGTHALQRPGEARAYPAAADSRGAAENNSDCQLQRPCQRRREPQDGISHPPQPRRPSGRVRG